MKVGVPPAQGIQQESAFAEKGDQPFVVRVTAYLHQVIDETSSLPATLLEQTHEIHNLVAGWQMNSSTQAAALLLPLLYYDLTPEDALKARFGARPVTLAKAVLRFLDTDEDDHKHQRKTSTRAHFTEIRRRLFLTAYSDLEIVLLCFAVHLNRTAWLNKVDCTTQEQWIQETSLIYVPLAEMLGLWAYRHVLADLSLSLSDRSTYEHYETKVVAAYERQQPFFAQLESEILEALSAADLGPAAISLHETSPASLHRRQPGFWDENTTLRIDIFVETEAACYLVLGLLHRRWPPDLQPPVFQYPVHNIRFSDTIAKPLFNGFRCLVTTVEADPNPDGYRWIEFHIRTHTMEAINLRGILAARLDPTPIRNTWWHDHSLAELINQSDVYQSSAFCVFTGTGEPIYPLRKGTTVVDSVFQRNPLTAPFVRTFWVNGVPVNPDTELHPLDIVETDADFRYPALKPEWDEAAHLPATRTHIRRFLRHLNRSPQRGRTLLETALQQESQQYGIRYPSHKLEQNLLKLIRRLHLPSLEFLYLRIAEGEINADELACRLIEDEFVPLIDLEPGEKWPPEKIQFARTSASKTKRITPGTPIIAIVIEDNTLLIYREDDADRPPHAKVIPVRWRKTDLKRESAEITITAPPRVSPLQILEALQQSAHHALLFHRIDTDIYDGNLTLNLLIDSASPDGLEQIQRTLQKLRDDHTITASQVWQLLPGEKRLIAGRHDKRQQNPYTLRQVRDSSMFFGRESEITRITDYIREGETFIILYGQKRIGKTSLLVQLAENLLPKTGSVLPVLCDAHSLSPFEPVPFLIALAEAAYRKLDGQLKRPDLRRGLRLRARDLEHDPYGAFAAWVNRVQKQLGQLRLLFMVDEFTRAEEERKNGTLENSFFDGLQWLAGNQGIGFVLCVHDNIYHHSSHSWGLLQRGHPIRLGALDTEAAARLVRQPLERLYQIHDDLVEDILDFTNCYPYFVHAICMELTSRMAQQPYDRITRDDLQHAITTVLRVGDHYFNHFRTQLDDLSWTILKTLANLSGGENGWISSDDLHNAVETYSGQRQRWKVAELIGELYRSGLVDARNLAGKAAYRISIRLFQWWLRQVTHPLVARDFERTS
ncbi:MAG: HD domain-containing protein [bacterium]|nr:HD domain-containing protein [bacterium]